MSPITTDHSNHNHDHNDDEATGARFERLAPEYQAAFARFLRRHYHADLQLLRRRLRHVSAPYAVDKVAAESSPLAFSQRVCAQQLLDFNAHLGTLLFRHPEQLLPLFHVALAKEVGGCEAGEPRLERGELPVIPLKVRRRLKVRVEHLPPVAPLQKSSISAIRSNDVKQLVQIAGTVVRTGVVRYRKQLLLLLFLVLLLLLLLLLLLVLLLLRRVRMVDSLTDCVSVCLSVRLLSR